MRNCAALKNLEEIGVVVRDRPKELRAKIGGDRCLGEKQIRRVAPRQKAEKQFVFVQRQKHGDSSSKCESKSRTASSDKTCSSIGSMDGSSISMEPAVDCISGQLRGPQGEQHKLGVRADE